MVGGGAACAAGGGALCVAAGWRACDGRAPRVRALGGAVAALVVLALATQDIGEGVVEIGLEGHPAQGLLDDPLCLRATVCSSA